MERKKELENKNIGETFSASAWKILFEIWTEGNLDSAIPLKKIALEPIRSGLIKAAT